MARILNDLVPENIDDKKYARYLKEAREKVDPSKISDDKDGTLWWFFRCLYADCRHHEIGNGFMNYDEELRLAAEAQAICEILTAREKHLALAI
ncbi:hypothetical protein IKG07_00765 [Candidatus Saccharibacteria bacterium]|nr:hypothetical protein [Candidatus Saccharibacteria bacterium]